VQKKSVLSHKKKVKKAATCSELMGSVPTKNKTETFRRFYKSKAKMTVKGFKRHAKVEYCL